MFYIKYVFFTKYVNLVIILRWIPTNHEIDTQTPNTKIISDIIYVSVNFDYYNK